MFIHSSFICSIVPSFTHAFISEVGFVSNCKKKKKIKFLAAYCYYASRWNPADSDAIMIILVLPLTLLASRLLMAG